MSHVVFRAFGCSCLLWLSLLLAGCQHTDPTTGTTTVNGQVVERFSQKPVPNAQVQVYHASTGGGYRPVGPSYPADASGRFAFSFEATEKYGYVLYATAPPGYVTEYALAPAPKAGHRNDDLRIPTLAPAWVRLQLVDEPPKSRVVIHTQGYEGAGDNFYYPRDTTVVRPLFAGSNAAVFWWIDEQGQTRTNNAHFQSIDLDTVTLRIPF